MASPTTRGKYKKQELGEGLNTWGLTSGLNGLFDVMDEALHGVNEITLTGTAYTLTSTNYTTNDIRFRQFKFTGNFAATITIPATQNWWIIENATGQTLTFDNGSNTATLGNAFFGLLVTNGTTVTCLTLPDGVNAKTVADNIASVNQVATDSASVIAVAAKSTEVGRLGTAAAVEDMAILGTADVVADMNTLATADVVADMNTLGTADVVADMNTLATADVVADMNTLATADVVADMNTLGTADVVADMNALATTDVLADMAALAETDVLADMAALGEADALADMALLGTTDVIADMALLATTDVIADMNTLGTADIVADMNTLATADVVADMNTLGTADVVNDMNVLGTSQNVTNMNTLAPIAGDITTTAGVSTSVTAYAKQYSAGSGDITTRGDGTGSVTEGDIRFRTDTDTMRVYTGSTWQDVAVTAGSFLQVSNNLSDLNNATTARTNLGLDALLAAKAPLASPNFSGTPQISGVNIATTANIPAGGNTLEATASGSIANGKPVIVNTDGTVSAVAETSVTQASGTPAVFESAQTEHISATFDSNSNKVVIAYQDNTNSSYGTAVVGTVDPSDNSISFGTPVVFESADSQYISATFDSNSNKVVIAYQDNGNSSYGTAIVGTLSGTSVSFGTPVVFESAYTYYIAATFDSNSNKVVIAYNDVGNSQYGTAIVGTLSSTSISFGSAAVFESAQSEWIAATFDSNLNKVVIAYHDAGNSKYGTAVVGVVNSSDNSIAFGTPVVFESADTRYISATFDSNSNKVVIAYQDWGNSAFGTAVVGTAGGTSAYALSFGIPVVFESAGYMDISATFDSNSKKIVIAYRDTSNSSYGTAITGIVNSSDTSIAFGTATVFESGSSYHVAATFDSNSNKVVIAYRDLENSSYGTAVVFQSGHTATNLTGENYIGIATDGPYTDSQTATIDIIAAVNEDQSSLTVGQTYFVQADGTLGTSADSPAVTAGTAIAATKIIVKG